MPYSDLERQRVRRFEKLADLDAAGCTVEEREEYEPHLAAGNVVFAGVDYARIAEQAAASADVIVWESETSARAPRPESSRGTLRR
jgi:predicted GTPase